MWIILGLSCATIMIIWDPMVKMKRYLTLLLCLTLLTLLVGCEEAPAADNKVNYRINIVTQSGDPLPDVKVLVYEDPSFSELVSVATTDAEGVVSFVDKPYDALAAVLQNVPAGYTAEEVYTISLGENRITLAQRALTPEELASVRYGVGDRVDNLTVTDCDGNQHHLSELLMQKKAIVLNFWFLNCAPCKMEFPFLQETYDDYGKDVAFLALNPVDGTNETVSNYRWENGLTFPMGICDPVYQDIFQIMSYPTTLIIDRTGTICVRHVGMFDDSAALCNALNYFTQDSYEQKLFDTIEEIPEV